MPTEKTLHNFGYVAPEPTANPDFLTEEAKLQLEIDKLLANKQRLSEQERRKKMELDWEKEQARKKREDLERRQYAASAGFNLPREERAKIVDGTPEEMRASAYRIFTQTPAHVLEKERQEHAEALRETARSF